MLLLLLALLLQLMLLLLLMLMLYMLLPVVGGVRAIVRGVEWIGEFLYAIVNMIAPQHEHSL